MSSEGMHQFGKDGMDMALNCFGAFTKNAQAIAVEVVDYSKKSLDGSAAAWEKLMGAKSLDKALQVQGDYLRSSYEDFIAEASKLGELYSDFAKDTYKPFEGAFAKVSK